MFSHVLVVPMAFVKRLEAAQASASFVMALTAVSMYLESDHSNWVASESSLANHSSAERSSFTPENVGTFVSVPEYFTVLKSLSWARSSSISLCWVCICCTTSSASSPAMSLLGVELPEFSSLSSVGPACSPCSSGWAG